MYLAQFVFTVIGFALQIYFTIYAIIYPQHEMGEGLVICIASNIYALLMFVLLFFFAFFRFKKEGKFFAAIAILNAAFATLQIMTSNTYSHNDNPILSVTDD